MLADLELSNEQLLTAVKSLSRVRDKSTNRWRRIDYRNLGAEELGAIYESLLELVPDRDGPYTFVLRDAAGNDRKSTGSYYTPTSLIDCLLDSTLDPVLDDATKQAEIAATAAGTDVSAAIAEALLSVTVCDPACGSGHFLVAAARRIAKRVAAVREHNPEPTLESLRTALRDVITRCVYGVDVNPMAVELAKVSLWLEALDPGKPLSFLDAHVKHGNALIGATPKLIDEGIPDAAFKAVEGDDPSLGRRREVRRIGERDQRMPATTDQVELFSDEIIFSQSNAELAAGLARIPHAPDGSLREVHRQAAAYRDGQNRPSASASSTSPTPGAPPSSGASPGRAPGDRQPRVPGAEGAGQHAAIPPPPRRRSTGSRASTASSTGTWSSPTSSASPTAREATHRPGHGLGRRVHGAARQPAVGQGRLQGQEVLQRGRAVHSRAGRAEATDSDRRVGAGEPGRGERYRAARRKVKSTFHVRSSSGCFPLCAKGLDRAMGVTRCRRTAVRRTVLHDRRAGWPRRLHHPDRDRHRRGRPVSVRRFTQRGGSRLAVRLREPQADFSPECDSGYKFCLLSLTGKALREPAAGSRSSSWTPLTSTTPSRVFALSPEEICAHQPEHRNTADLPRPRDADLTVAIYQPDPSALGRDEA